MPSGPVVAAKRHLPAVALLVALGAALYGQALGHHFLVTWDDRTYVTANPLITALTWENVKAIFTRSYFYNYAPVHLLSYLLDRELWGLQPAGFVLGNVALHVASGALFYLLLITLSWRRAAALVAAVIFVAHPVQVESVAWISQRKTVLSGLFFVLALQAWVLYRREQGRARALAYAASLVSFALALLTKATTVVFPLVALAFDLCSGRELRDKRCWLDKAPFLGAAVAVAAVTVLAQSPEIGGGTTGYHGGSPWTTLLTMLPIFARYVGMTLWPTGLSAVYAPYIRTTIDLAVVGSAFLLAGVVALGVLLYRRRRMALFWLLVFFVGLLPVSQIVPFVTLINDRYLYLPLLGAAALLADTAFLAIDRAGGVRRPLGVAVAAALAALVGHDLLATARRVPVWRDDHALWEDAVRTVPESPRAHFQLAHVRELDKDLPGAIGEYEAGLRLAPLPSERFFLGRLYERTGALEAALAQYRQALDALPSFADARRSLARVHNNLAIGHATQGRLDRALPHFEAAAALDPQDPELHYNLGSAYLAQGLAERGLAELRRAVALAPGDPRFARRLAEAARR